MHAHDMTLFMRVCNLYPYWTCNLFGIVTLCLATVTAQVFLYIHCLGGVVLFAVPPVPPFALSCTRLHSRPPPTCKKPPQMRITRPNLHDRLEAGYGMTRSGAPAVRAVLTRAITRHAEWRSRRALLAASAQMASDTR